MDHVKEQHKVNAPGKEVNKEKAPCTEHGKANCTEPHKAHVAAPKHIKK